MTKNSKLNSLSQKQLVHMVESLKGEADGLMAAKSKKRLRKRARRKRLPMAAAQDVGSLQLANPAGSSAMAQILEDLRKLNINESVLPTDAFVKYPGLTKTGLQYAINQMDPAASSRAPEGTINPGALNPGVPDLQTGNIFMHKQEMTIVEKAPSGTSGTETWDMLIVVLPFPTSPCLVFKKDSADTTTWDDLVKATWHLNSTTDNAQWWFYDEYLASSAYLTTEFTKARVVSRSLTTTLNGPNIQKSGIITSGQVPSQVYFAPYTDHTLDGLTPAETKVGQVRHKLPQLGSTDLLKLDSLSKTRSAEQGDYNVLRVSKETGVPDNVACFIGGEYSCCLADQTEFNDATWYTSDHHVSFADSFNTGLVYLEGLGAEEVVQLVLHGFLQGQPLSDGAYGNLAQPAPPNDPQAIRLIADITNTLPHSYPASYNDLGGLLGLIGKAVKGVTGIVSKMGIPIVSDVADVAHTVASHVIG